MEELKELMEQNYLSYASYVILERAIPNVFDGLKPVQRRILHTLFRIDDGKLHKVANVSGQTMALHPHGDAPITDALVNMAMKGFLLDTQGNFGNTFTGDPAAAARYIETRLSNLARDTMFNPKLTNFIPSYDGRNEEPTILPAKIPLLLMQGAEGIAVGMSTRIFPHNFIELIEAEIAVLEKKEFKLLPDFITGGVMDASQYDGGRGKVKLRASIDIVNDKTLCIREICHGTTTESLIRSIDEAAKRGKIKIDSINDYTTDKVEIEIKLPRGVYAKDILKPLYAFTDCEVSLNSQVVVIKDNLPLETTVEEVLRLHAEKLQEHLKRELEIKRDALLDKIFEKTLEQIFIENRLYKNIEKAKSYEEVHTILEKSLKPYHKKLSRVPTKDDRERLLNIPIRRISRFDIEKNMNDIMACEEDLVQVEKDLKSIKRFTIKYLKGLAKKYSKDFPRRTQLEKIQEIDMKAIQKQNIKVGFDPSTGFIGTKVKSDTLLDCTNLDKLLVMFKDGTYSVINIPEKQYLHHDGAKVIFCGVADKTTINRVVYKDPKTDLCFAKRFVVDKFITGKTYEFLDKGMKLELISTQEDKTIELSFKPAPKQKVKNMFFELDSVMIKGVKAKGVRIANKPVKKVKVIAKK